ncbi:MarR family winged helix-turn-helix transcriptional regulator [Ruegeria conchae]|uniref:MarR family transcriptional regulator n=1 Tax=Ruegeria conchae TaxID=981384 RepID=A0A497ZMU0_9RHOB|nr:MarR family winged helix-turn-helix transcriptional regulator [Ruegeria conchae]RLK08393.1 MarR family transcriptional regulator [Ruegeria conchae]
MPDARRTEEGEAVTALILDVFRLNGRLQLAGDRLVSELGLTSARWQILGAIAYSDRPESVAWHARTMGVHRQGVQRIINELSKEGIVEFQSNPHHKRAHLVVMTPKGQELYEAAIAKQVPWVNELSEGLSPDDIATAQNVVDRLKSRLEEASMRQDQSPSQSGRS